MREVLGAFADAVQLAVPAVVVVAVVTAWRTIRGRGTGRAWSATIGGGVLVAGLVLVTTTTLLPHAGNTSQAGVNTAPGESILRYLRYGDVVLTARNLGLNVLLFVPVGIGAALRWRGVWPSVGFGLLLSVAVEILQWVLPLGRSVDVDDVLLNTVGAALGVLVVALARRVRDAAAGPRGPDGRGG